jgi:23S rRNA (guanosine2251-2'-O)-methyltransferase
VPWVRVVNLSRALDILSEAGYWRIALDGKGKQAFPQALPSGPVALVLGAEGEGIRQNVMQHCDAVARLPIGGAIESLNVSTAAAVALYAAAIRETPE